MKIASLPNHTRTELHNYVKKNIRKYYKGLKNGSLRYDFFVETILSKKPQPDWLKEYPNLEQDIEFKKHLIEYIKGDITRYILFEDHKYNFSFNSPSPCGDTIKKDLQLIPMTIKDRKEFNKVLNNNGYFLSIPIKFLTYTESNYLKDFILYGTPIPFEWEKVLNYIKKIT